MGVGVQNICFPLIDDTIYVPGFLELGSWPAGSAEPELKISDGNKGSSVQCSSFQGPKPFMALCGCICFSFYGTVWSYLRYLKIDFLSPLEKNDRPGSEANTLCIYYL